MSTEIATQYRAIQKGGPFTVASIAKPNPGPNEVSIRLKAIALNPMDWKRLCFDFMIEKWPAVLGVDGAGVVEAVGQGVNTFKAGDEVFSLFGHDSKAAAFQEVAVVPQMFVAKKPRSLSFEEAASLPICYCTAAAVIYSALKIPLPFLPGGATIGPQPQFVLVLGGSACVGAAAIQILRLALPTAAIFTTSSPQHHAHLRSLGASRCFDQKSPFLVADIKSSTPGVKGVDMIIDAVASGAPQTDIYDTLRPDGRKEVGEVMTGTQVQVPQGVRRTVANGWQVFETPGGKNAMIALAGLLNDERYKLPARVQSVGSKFEAIDKGLELLKEGVSGMKLVVTV